MARILSHRLSVSADVRSCGHMFRRFTAQAEAGLLAPTAGRTAPTATAFMKSRRVRLIVGLLLRFSFDLGKQFGHRRAQSLRKLLNDQDRWHSLTSLQQADVIPVKVGVCGECLLRE